MRTLKFESPEAYEVMYEGLLVSKTHGLDTRLHSRILTKLEAIGMPQPTDGRLYTLTEGEIKLEESEYELVKRLLDVVEWNGTGAKKAGPMLEWLDSIKSD